MIGASDNDLTLLSHRSSPANGADLSVGSLLSVVPVGQTMTGRGRDDPRPRRAIFSADHDGADAVAIEEACQQRRASRGGLGNEHVPPSPSLRRRLPARAVEKQARSLPRPKPAGAPQERADLPYRQRNRFWVLPWEHAHFALGASIAASIATA